MSGNTIKKRLIGITSPPLRRLDIDTANLLIMSGYQIIDYHRSILFEQRKQMTLKGDTKKEMKGRISFFKRLSMQKGNIAARWEDIIIAVNPYTAKYISDKK